MGELYALQQLGNDKGATFYALMFRRVGWGIQWHEKTRQAGSEDHKAGLVVYQYHDTIEACLEAELVRLEGLPDVTANVETTTNG